MVYFIQGATGGRIKIGSSGNPWQRAADLQTGNPEKLVVIAVIPGERVDEVALHDRFAALRGKGEWFSPGPELLAFIEGIKAAQRPKPPQPMPTRASLFGLTPEAFDAIRGHMEAWLTDRRAEALIEIAGGSELFTVDGEYTADSVDDDLCMAAMRLEREMEKYERMADLADSPYQLGVAAVPGGRVGLAVNLSELRGIIDRHRLLLGERRLHQDVVGGNDSACRYVGVDAGRDSPLDDDPAPSEAGAPVH